MLVLHNPKTSSRSSHSSLVSLSHQIHKSQAIQPTRIQHSQRPSSRMTSRTTDDIFSSARSQHLQIFNQVENFQRNMMKQINNMFSFGGFGSMGSPSDFMSSMLLCLRSLSYGVNRWNTKYEESRTTKDDLKDICVSNKEGCIRKYVS